MSYSRLIVQFCEPCTHEPVLIILGSEPFAVSCKSSPDSVIESIKQGAERIRLGQRLTNAITDMVVRDPAVYSVQGQTARPTKVPKDYVLKDIINMAIGFAVNETIPKLGSLWKIQPEQGSPPVCVFDMYLILDDEPVQRGNDQGAISALHLLAQAAEASDAAAAAGGCTGRKGHAASHNEADTAEHGDQAPRAVIPRAVWTRQRKHGTGKQAVGGVAQPRDSAAPAGKGVKKSATATKSVGGKKIDSKSQPGKRTLSLEQLPNSPSPVPAQAKVRKVGDSKKAPAHAPAATGAAGSPVPKNLAQVIQSYSKPKPATSMRVGPSNVQNMGIDAQQVPSVNATPERMRTRRDKSNGNTASAPSDSPQFIALRSIEDALAGGEGTVAVAEDGTTKQTRATAKRSRPVEQSALMSSRADMDTVKSSHAGAASLLAQGADMEIVAEVSGATKGSGGRSQQPAAPPAYAIRQRPHTVSRAAGVSAAGASPPAPKASPSGPNNLDTAYPRAQKPAMMPSWEHPGAASAPHPVPPIKPPRYRWLQEIATSKPRKCVQQDATDTVKKVCKSCNNSLPQSEFRVGQQRALRATCASCRMAGQGKAKPTLAPAGKKCDATTLLVQFSDVSVRGNDIPRCRLCTICNQHKPLEDYRSSTGKPNEYCSICMHYVNQLSYKGSTSKSKYRIDDIREAYKEGTLDSLFVPLGKKRCSNCTAVLPEDQFSAVEDSGQTRTKVKMLMNLCNACRDNRATRNDAKLHAHTHSPRKPTPRSRGTSSWGAMAGEYSSSMLTRQALDAARASQVGGAAHGHASNMPSATAANASKSYVNAVAAANSAEGSDTVAHAAHAAQLRGLHVRTTSAVPAGQQQRTTEPSVHAEQAAPPDDDGRGSAMDSVVDVMFTEGLGDVEANAAEAAAAVAASGSRKAAGTEMPEIQTAADDASHAAADDGGGNEGGNQLLSPDEQLVWRPDSFVRSDSTGNRTAGGVTGSAYPRSSSRADSPGVHAVSPSQVFPAAAQSKQHANKQVASISQGLQTDSDVPVVPVVPEQVQPIINPFTDSMPPSSNTLSTLRGSWRVSPSADGIKGAVPHEGRCESVVMANNHPQATGMPAMHPQEDAKDLNIQNPSTYHPEVQISDIFTGTTPEGTSTPSGAPK